MLFRKVIFSVFMLLIFLQQGFTVNNKNILFLTSNPINSTVYLNNKKLRQKTPLLLKHVNPGQYTVRIEKKDYISLEKTISIGKNKNSIYSLSLISEKQLTDSRYSLYPNQRYIDSLNIVIPVLGGFSAALTYNEISNPRYNDSKLSPFVLSTYAVNTVFIAADIALHIDKNKYKNNILLEKNSRSISNDLILFKEADQAFRKGKFKEAADGFEKLISDENDSQYFPEALYKSAVISMIEKNYNKAAEIFELIIKKYPDADVYDKSLKNLAEIYVIKEQYKKAVYSLEDILYIKNIYTEDEIRIRIKEISNIESKTS